MNECEKEKIDRGAGDIPSFDSFVGEVESALTRLGRAHFDFPVNNAGNNHRNMPFAEATEEEFDSACNVHFKGMFFLTRKLVPLMNDGERIFNILTAFASMASQRGAVYAAMKGAVEVLSRHMALETGSRRIAVNVVAPGRIPTDFSGGIVRDYPAANRWLHPARNAVMISLLLSCHSRRSQVNC